MWESLLLFIEDSSSLLWLIGATLALFAWGVYSYRRNRRLLNIMRAVFGSYNKPILFYDDRDRLVFHTSGLILFDKSSLRRLRKLGQRPVADRELRGEIEIDNNLYRFSSSLLEFEPGRKGTIVSLEYQKPAPVSR